MATPLHNHTHASAKDGVSTEEDIVKRAEELGFSAVGCTDHDLVEGHVGFYKKMIEVGLKPILGIETYQSPGARQIHKFPSLREKETGFKTDNFHLILLAQNQKGLENLWAVTSEAHRSGFWFNARVDFDLLKQFNEGIICTSACMNSMIHQAVMGNPLVENTPDELVSIYKNIFGDRFYIELSTYSGETQATLNQELVSLARTHSVPLTYGNDAHYAWPGQYDLHEVMLCVQYAEKLADRTEKHHTPDLYIMGEEDVRERLSYLGSSVVDEVISNSDAIANSCDTKIPDRRNRVPVFIQDKKYENSWEMFYAMATDGFEAKKHLFTQDEDVYLQRFIKEMKVIYSAGLYNYFLIVQDYIKYARTQMLVGPGRGSIGGCLVAWLIDITEVDPIKYDLIFERFYNIGREKGLPDIDTDFPKRKRELVKKYIMQKYGEAYVADIGTTGRMQPRSAIQDIARVLQIPYPDVNSINRILDGAIKQGLQPESWEDIWTDSNLGPQLLPWKEKYPELFEYAEMTHKMKRQYGVHASGILIADEPLDYTCPLSSRAVTGGKKGERKLATQWDYRTVEELGFMKMDLLGLINLDELEEVNLLLQEQGKDPVDWSALQYQEAPEGVWDLIHQGFTVGVFQIEDGQAAKMLSKNMKPRSIEDLAVLTALNRPGPLLSKDKHGVKAIDKFLAGHRGESVTYINDLVRQATEETFGVFVFQEQIIKFMTLIGYTLTEADDVRSIMGKKKREKIDEEYKRYLPRALNHMPQDEAEEAWDQIKEFGSYGFNKSHSIEYSIITYWTAYAKYVALLEKILAGMRLAEDQKEKVRFLNDAKRMKVSIMAPQVNLSGVTTTLKDEGIIYGFSDIKGIGQAPAKWLVKHQPYASVEDLLEKIENNKISTPNGFRVAVNATQVENLVKLGAFGKDAMWHKKIKKDVYEDIVPLQGEELLNLEEELLGLSLSDNSAMILDEYEDIISESCSLITDLEEPGEYFIAGVIQSVDFKKSKNGNEYAKIVVENSDGEVSFQVWDKELKRLGFMWRRRQVGIFHLKVVQRQRDGSNSTYINLVEAQPLLPKLKGGGYVQQRESVKA